jgi:hypothetical protein
MVIQLPPDPPMMCFMVFHDVSKALAGRNLQGLFCFIVFQGVPPYPSKLCRLECRFSGFRKETYTK